MHLPSAQISPTGLHYFGSLTSSVEHEIEEAARYVDPVFWNGMADKNWHYGAARQLSFYDSKYAQLPFSQKHPVANERKCLGVCFATEQMALVVENLVLPNAEEPNAEITATFYHEMAHSVLHRFSPVRPKFDNDKSQSDGLTPELEHLPVRLVIA